MRRRVAEILCLLDTLGVGGLQNGVVNLVNRLPADRYRVTLLALRPDMEIRNRITNPDVRILTVRERRLRVPGLTSVIRRLRPDLVHTRNWPTVEGIPAARLAGVSRVVHGEHGLNADEAGGLKARRAALRRVLFPLADKIVTVSEAIRETMLDRTGVAPRRVTCIPNGVDTERFRPGAAEEARSALGVHSARRVFGSVGRLDPVKDYPTLLRAFALRARADPRSTLILIGEGPEEPALRRLAAELGVAERVRFAGRRDDVSRLYPAFDLFVLPSRTEGMSNTLLEAQSCGVPAAASRVGGNPEVVEEGETGWLFAAGDVEALAGRLELAAADPDGLRAAGDRARERVLESFSLEAMVASYDELYRELLDRGS